jgi:hypothetical protein
MQSPKGTGVAQVVIKDLLVAAALLVFVVPASAHASSFIWGNETGEPTQIEMSSGGIYTVPLNTPAPGYVLDPFAFGPLSAVLYRIDNSSGSPVREQLATF